MDTLNTLLIGWIIFSLFVIFLGTFFYDQVIRGTLFKTPVKQENEAKSVASDVGGAVSDSGGNISEGRPIVVETPPAAVPTIVPQEVPASVPAPIAAGADPDAVVWVNQILCWLYNAERPQGSTFIRDAWATGLNDYTVTSALDTGVLVEILEVLPQSPAPQLTNVVVDCPPGTDDMTITCDCMMVVYFRILCTRTQGPVTTESEYACAVESLAGRMHIDVYTTERQATIKFVGWPQVTLALEGLRNNSSGLDELTLQDVISELLTVALRNVFLDLHFTQIPNFPPFNRARHAPDRIVPVGYDAMVAAQRQSIGNGSAAGIPGLNGKRLLVKIVKAASVGCDQDVSEAYAVVEMDAPEQRFTTSVVRETNSPFWDEQFLFDLSEGTLELLFELYDKSTSQFLGLAIVGIEELVATPSQRQIIPLQPRPYEDDQVSGSLTVEFLFLDRADIPDLALRASDTTQRVSPRGDKITTTTTTYLKSPDTPDLMVNGSSDSVVSAALRDIEERNIPVSNNANKSTMIIHASRKPEEEQLIVDTDVNGISNIPSSVTSEAGQGTDSPSEAYSETVPIEERGRSRGRNGKRDSFFGTLKKRFSRSRLRSKSMDPDSVVPGSRDASVSRTNGHHIPDNVPRSISMERQSHRASGAGGDGGSTRSSLSDHSAISSSSTRTYVNENSTLIVEAVENGVTKHYLIPLSLQQRSKWRKKGTKLHVFNEHSFVAKHMSSQTPCQVCQKSFSRRLGKQGYECRDCGFKSHKPCHVKTDTVCPNSTVNSMDLEIIKDTKEERRSWMKKNRDS